MELKLCPTCKTFVFDDMDTCYGCMYRFGSDPQREEAVRRAIVGSDFPEDAIDEDARRAIVVSPSISPPGAPVRAVGEGADPWPPRRDDVPLAVGGAGAARDASCEPVAAPFPLAQTVALAGWQVSLQAKEPWPQGLALQITVEPAPGAGS